MGCDIHAYLEIKVERTKLRHATSLTQGVDALETDGRWLYYGEVQIDRNYALFEKLAGVRGELSNAMFPVRGFPSDAAIVTLLLAEHRGEDGHTRSWISSGEMREIDGWWKNFKSSHRVGRNEERQQASLYDYAYPGTLFLFGNSIDGWWSYPQDYPEWLEDVRLVFWFDN